MRTCASIVSACNCPTKIISNCLNCVLTPLLALLPSHIYDTNHIVSLFNFFSFFCSTSQLLVTLDIKCFIEWPPTHTHTTKAFLHFNTSLSFSQTLNSLLVKLILSFKHFLLVGKFYQQFTRIAVGMRMGPTYVYLFVSSAAIQIFSQFTVPTLQLYGH